MNPFKNRKKAKDDLSAPRPSVDSESSSPFRMFGRKKSQDDNAKPELDLATALPSNDDFRTSLLMTGLSARFSMLREQDDPNTKVGKASDDSVLFPKHQSRMGDFGLGPGALQDIAEVESIRAPYARTGSFHSSDDGASVNTSIMNRGKPVEGNVLFGGKQRIYKITGTGKGGNSSRTLLFDEDSSQSAFQKWRQAEREKEQQDNNQSQNESGNYAHADESEDRLPDVYDSYPQTDRDRRRETTSTMSSGPSAARNSTAATSITSSQPASSVKDWQAGVAPGIAGSTPGMERSVTRTRRLYEQSLNQDMQEQQSSALSRIDTLSRQRAFGARTPDLSPMPNSPVNSNSDRLFDRRPLIAKASAPNLRSVASPPFSAGPMSPPEPNSQFPAPEQRANFGGLPPLSPPMSETEDHNSVSVQPGERSKGVPAMFGRPPQAYDETKYAQRTRQLQQGRDSSRSRQRTESNATVPTARSASVASSHGNASEKHESAFKTTEPMVKEESHQRTFFNDDDGDSIAGASETFESRRSPPVPTPQVILERPNDHDHPALRNADEAAVPQDSAATASTIINSTHLVTSPKSDSPEDSPTLGPNSGLSSMVRQHLRNTSTASSIYDTTAADAQSDTRLHLGQPASSTSGQLAIDTSYLDLTEADWDMAHGNRTGVVETAADQRTLTSEASPAINVSTSLESPTMGEQDDFARHLADGARRVREKLNSYVDPDSAPVSPIMETPSDSARTGGGTLRPNPLGILKSKSSRGSLIDRDRNRDQSSSLQPKQPKVLGLDTMSSSPVYPTLREKEEAAQAESAAAEEGRTSEEKENVHAGLRAFRQARRELQKMKELESKQRHQAPHVLPPRQHGAPDAGGAPQQPRRLQSQERGPPPSSYTRSPSDDIRSRSASRSESRASERDRSGSDTSNGGRSHSRPARVMNGPIPYEEQHGSYGHGANGMPRPNPALRSPVPPGMENKRPPPMMSPLHYGASSPGGFVRPDASLGGRSPGRNMFDVSHDHAEGYRQGASRHGQLAGATTSPNLHSPSMAPPLPPINPRRRNKPDLLTADRGGNMSVTAPTSPLQPHDRAKSPGALYMSEDDGGPEQYRSRLRRVTSEASVRNGLPSGPNTSPPRRPPMPNMPASAGPPPKFIGGAF